MSANYVIAMKPAGNLLFGRSMLTQFGYELELQNIEHPVMLTTGARFGRARRAASTVSFKNGLRLAKSPEPSDDFLILAGGKYLVDRWADDPRPKAWIMLDETDLLDFTEPAVDFIVADAAFLGKKADFEGFFRKYAFSISGGLSPALPKLKIPQAFSFSRRTKVIAGNYSLESLPVLVDEGEFSRPLVLTDRGVRAAGVFDYISDVLDGVEYEVFDDIPPDSSSLTVNEISSLYRQKECNGIIAVGGGSVLDTGKGVFLNVSLGADDLGLLAGSNRIPLLKVPFLAVPTTSGTGSEVTKVAVISDEQRGRKILYVSPYLMPDTAVLDGRLTAGLPAHLGSITGMDALSHAVEAYTCLGKNPVSDQLAWAAVELIRDNLIPVMSEPGNLEMRLNLALASNLAGQAFSNSMVGMVHTIGHSVGAVCHAPHGSCMSVLLPESLKYNLPEISGLLAELLPALAGSDAAETVPYEKRAAAFIDKVREMNENLSRLTSGRHPVSLGGIRNRDGEPLVRPDHFRKIAELSLGDASIIYNPVELRLNDVEAILERSY